MSQTIPNCPVCVQCSVKCGRALNTCPHKRVRATHKLHTCNQCGGCQHLCKGCKGIPKTMKDSKIAEWESHQVVKGGTPAKLVNELGRALGLEIELSTWGSIKNQSFDYLSYQAHRDGSVKPSEEEMVLSPLSGDKFIAGMIELSKAIYTSRATVNESCGLHVHVNAKDVNYWALRRFLWIYKGLERDMYRVLCTQDRANSRFCRFLDEGVQDAISKMWEAKTQNDIKQAVFTGVYDRNLTAHIYQIKDHLKEQKASIETRRETYRAVAQQMKEVRANKYGLDRSHVTRYFGLNLHSWTHRGTIEYRMKEGVTDVRELIFWPLFCGWLVEKAIQLPDSTVMKMPPMGVVDFSRLFMPKSVADWVQMKSESAPSVRDWERNLVEVPAIAQSSRDLAAISFRRALNSIRNIEQSTREVIPPASGRSVTFNRSLAAAATTDGLARGYYQGGQPTQPIQTTNPPEASEIFPRIEYGGSDNDPEF